MMKDFFNKEIVVSIPEDILAEYEYKVAAFTENTVRYFMEVLGLNERMTNEELSAAIIQAMKEDCEASEEIKDVLTNSEKVKGLLHAEN